MINGDTAPNGAVRRELQEAYVTEPNKQVSEVCIQNSTELAALHIGGPEVKQILIHSERLAVTT